MSNFEIVFSHVGDIFSGSILTKYYFTKNTDGRNLGYIKKNILANTLNVVTGNFDIEIWKNNTEIVDILQFNSTSLNINIIKKDVNFISGDFFTVKPNTTIELSSSYNNITIGFNYSFEVY